MWVFVGVGGVDVKPTPIHSSSTTTTTKGRFGLLLLLLLLFETMQCHIWSLCVYQPVILQILANLNPPSAAAAASSSSATTGVDACLVLLLCDRTIKLLVSYCTVVYWISQFLYCEERMLFDHVPILRRLLQDVCGMIDDWFCKTTRREGKYLRWVATGRRRKTSSVAVAVVVIVAVSVCCGWRIR